MAEQFPSLSWLVMGTADGEKALVSAQQRFSESDCDGMRAKIQPCFTTVVHVSGPFEVLLPLPPLPCLHTKFKRCNILNICNAAVWNSLHPPKMTLCNFLGRPENAFTLFFWDLLCLIPNEVVATLAFLAGEHVIQTATWRRKWHISQSLEFFELWFVYPVLHAISLFCIAVCREWQLSKNLCLLSYKDRQVMHVMIPWSKTKSWHSYEAIFANGFVISFVLFEIAPRRPLKISSKFYWEYLM